MTFIDKDGMKYKAVKQNNKYYLLTIHSNNKGDSKYHKIEVKGKKNVMKYIKNNKLKRYEELYEFISN